MRCLQTLEHLENIQNIKYLKYMIYKHHHFVRGGLYIYIFPPSSPLAPIIPIEKNSLINSRHLGDGEFQVFGEFESFQLFSMSTLPALLTPSMVQFKLRTPLPYLGFDKIAAGLLGLSKTGLFFFSKNMCV